jgi:hypothetical protein
MHGPTAKDAVLLATNNTARDAVLWLQGIPETRANRGGLLPRAVPTGACRPHSAPKSFCSSYQTPPPVAEFRQSPLPSREGLTIAHRQRNSIIVRSASRVSTLCGFVSYPTTSVISLVLPNYSLNASNPPDRSSRSNSPLRRKPAVSGARAGAVLKAGRLVGWPPLVQCRIQFICTLGGRPAAKGASALLKTISAAIYLWESGFLPIARHGMCFSLKSFGRVSAVINKSIAFDARCCHAPW